MKLEIELLKNPAVYHEGEKIEAILVVQTKEPMKIKGITAKCEGLVKTHWEIREEKGQFQKEHQKSKPIGSVSIDEKEKKKSGGFLGNTKFGVGPIKLSPNQVMAGGKLAKKGYDMVNGKEKDNVKEMDDGQVIEIFNGEIQVMKEKKLLMGKGELPLGEKRIPFSFYLPDRCLPSFDEAPPKILISAPKLGKITYSITVEIEGLGLLKKGLSMIKMGNTTNKEFLVAPIVDLGLRKELNEGLSEEKCLSFSGGGLLKKKNKGEEMVVRASIPRQGFISDENLVIDLFINNQSNKVIDQLEVSLEKHSEYVAFLKKGKEFSIDDRFLGDGPKGDFHQMHKSYTSTFKTQASICIKENSHGSLSIPFLFPKSMASFECAIIRFSYSLKIKVFSSKQQNSSIIFDFPIVMGSKQEIELSIPNEPEEEYQGFVERL